MHGFYHECIDISSVHLCCYSYIKADQTLSLLFLSFYCSTTNNGFKNLKLQYTAQCTPLPAGANPDKKGCLTASKLKKILRTKWIAKNYLGVCVLFILWPYPFRVIITFAVNCCAPTDDVASPYSLAYICKFLGSNRTLINYFNRHRLCSRSKVNIYAAPCASLRTYVPLNSYSSHRLTWTEPSELTCTLASRELWDSPFNLNWPIII
jgi:hypothetical protein